MNINGQRADSKLQSQYRGQVIVGKHGTKTSTPQSFQKARLFFLFMIAIKLFKSKKCLGIQIEFTAYKHSKAIVCIAQNMLTTTYTKLPC